MKKTLAVLVSVVVLGFFAGCTPPPQSASGVGKAEVKVPTGPDGLTSEQRNIRDRLVEDNRPGSVKHLYVISAYSGQVIIYSTVRDKITSGGKRLAPTKIVASTGGRYGFGVDFGNSTQVTDEVLQDDGTYGSSTEYLYWWDTKGVYHQHYVGGGQIVHVSNQPLAVKGIIINMEISQKPEEQKQGEPRLAHQRLAEFVTNESTRKALSLFSKPQRRFAHFQV